MKFEVGDPKDAIAVIILIIITAIFSGGGVLLGAWFNYVTTGVWFL